MRPMMIGALTLTLSGCQLIDDLFSSVVLPQSNPTGVSFGLYGSEQNAFLGTSLAAGDFDADGRADLAVVAPSQRIGRSNGMIGLWNGPWDGVIDLVSEAPTRILGGPDMGLHAVVAGDFDGDGAADLAVVDSYWGGERGRIHVLGGPFAPGDYDLQGPHPRWDGLDLGGWNLFRVPDLDGDGADELIASDRNRTELVLLRHPFEGGLIQASPDRIVFPVGEDFSEGLVVASGDIDGDGSSDLVIGAQEASEVFVFTGDIIGRTSVESADLVFRGEPHPAGEETGGDRFGSSLAIADLDGDGQPDLAVGAYSAEGGRGRVDVFQGPLQADAAPLLSFVGAPGGRIGATLVPTGDLDGDGVIDLATFRHEWSNVFVDRHGTTFDGDGSAFFLLNVLGDGVWDLSEDPVVATWMDDGVQFGTSHNAVAADFDGDGVVDLAAGAPHASMVGAVYGFFGATRDRRRAVGCGGPSPRWRWRPI